MGTAQSGADNGATRPPRVFAPVSQRERLLDGMAQTVAERGYAATSVADVLSAAGISRRTFYERFADKEDCFLAAYDTIVALAQERVASACHGAPSWEQGVESGLNALLALLAQEPAFARLGVVEVLAAGPRGLARRDATLQRFIALLGERHKARPEPVVSPPALVAQAIVGGIYELLYSHLVRGEADRLPQLTGELLHFALMLLGTPPRTA
ncbi:MAG TPA: TetR/AcrR family transcriptional regulator [Conexibacter sp.]|jgi:AcrR family transcriptional regulator